MFVLTVRDITIFMFVCLCVRPVKAKKRGGGFTKVCQLSPQLEKVVGTSQLGRTEVIVIFFHKCSAMFWSGNLLHSFVFMCIISGCEENVGLYPRKGLARPKGQEEDSV